MACASHLVCYALSPCGVDLHAVAANLLVRPVRGFWRKTAYSFVMLLLDACCELACDACALRLVRYC